MWVTFIALLEKEVLSEKPKEMKKPCFQVLNFLLLESRNIGRKSYSHEKSREGLGEVFPVRRKQTKPVPGKAMELRRKKPVRGHRFLYKAWGTFFFAFRGCSRAFDKLSGHVEVHVDSACLSVSLFADYRMIFVQRLALVVQNRSVDKNYNIGAVFYRSRFSKI